MKRIFYSLPNISAVEYYRCFLPVSHCHKPLAKEGIELVMDTKLDLRDEYDTYVFHRLPGEQFVPTVKRLKDRGKVVVWQLDDLLTAIPDSNPAKRQVKYEDVRRLHECLGLCDLVICATERLAQEFGLKTVVAPNLIDLSGYPPFQEQKEEWPVRILWQGSESHRGDLPQIVDAVKALNEKWAEKVVFHFLGLIPPGLEDECFYHPWVGLDKFIPMLLFLKPHICLGPLAFNRFNRAKSPIKYFESAAINACFVGTDLEPYSSVITSDSDGILVHPDEWVSALDYLIGDVAARNEMLAAARKTVTEKHSWHGSAKGRWLEVFRQLVRR